MSYSSKKFQKQWTYDPHGTTHNDRIGQILSRGMDLSSTLKQEAIAGVQTARAFELSEAAHAHDAPKPLNETQQSSSCGDAEGRGMVWVDTQTKASLGAVSEKPFEQPMPEASPLDTLNEKQLAVATLSPNERSMHLWRKLNPGCMQSTIRPSVATAKDTFKMRDGLIRDGIDKTNFRQKTEFTAYVEAQIRHVPR